MAKMKKTDITIEYMGQQKCLQTAGESVSWQIHVGKLFLASMKAEHMRQTMAQHFHSDVYVWQEYVHLNTRRHVKSALHSLICNDEQ